MKAAWMAMLSRLMAPPSRSCRSIVGSHGQQKGKRFLAIKAAGMTAADNAHPSCSPCTSLSPKIAAKPLSVRLMQIKGRRSMECISRNVGVLPARPRRTRIALEITRNVDEKPPHGLRRLAVRFHRFARGFLLLDVAGS